MDLNRQMMKLVRAIRSTWEDYGLKAESVVVVSYSTLVLVLSRHDSYDTAFVNLRKVLSPDLQSFFLGLGLGAGFLLQALVPMLAILISGGGLRDYGLGTGKTLAGVKISAFLFLLFLPCALMLLSSNAVRSYYEVRGSAFDSIGFVAVLPIREFFSYFSTEFIYRGLLLFAVLRNYGKGPAMIVSTIPYVLIHSDKPLLEAFGSLPAGVALAFLAIRTESIWYGLILHTFVGIAFGLAVNAL